MTQLEQIIGGLTEVQRVDPDAVVHTHVDEFEPNRLAVREADGDTRRPDAEVMRRFGWSGDADTGDWFLEIDEGC